MMTRLCMHDSGVCAKVFSNSKGQPAITVNCPESQIAYFDLYYFYFACTTGTQISLTSLPVACNMTVQGYSPPPTVKRVATATFTFATNGGLEQDMQKAILPDGFKGLYYANFFIQSASTATTAGLVDSVANAIYSKSPLQS